MHILEEHTTLVGITELRTRLKEILEALKHSRVVLALRNAPLAVLVPIERYRKIEALLEQVEDRALGYLAKERDHTPDSDYLTLDVVEKKLKLR